MGSESYTFISSCNSFQFTIKSKFLDRYGIDPKTERVYILMTQYNLKDYLHNQEGPAIIDLNTRQESYYIDGKFVNPNDGTKLSQKFNFNKKLTRMFEVE